MKWPVGLVALVFLATMALTGIAAADIDPPGCTTNAMNMIVSRSPGITHNGDTVTYFVTLTNINIPGQSCNVTGLDLSFTAPAANGTATGAVTALATNATFNVGDSVTYGPINVVLALNPGVTSATAQAHFDAVLHDAEPEDSVSDTKTVTVQVIEPEIDVTKVADTEVSKVGDTINYLITVTNTGNTTLNGITVTDTIIGDLSASFADSLTAGASEAHSFPYVVQPGDADPLVNTVTATGTDVVADAHSTVSDTASDTVDLVHPSIDVTKVADTEVSKVGDTINYLITVTNTSPDTALVNITVSDTLMGDLGASFADTLAAGASEAHSFPYVVQPGDADPLVNTVTVHANPTGLANDITDTASDTVDLVHPTIDITKVADTEVSKVGDTINYLITITNTSVDTALVNITVSDTLMGDLGASFADTLAAGASEAHSFPYVVQPGDADPLVNTVTVHANPTGLANDITDTASDTVDLVHPTIDVTKVADTEVSKVGDTINYLITITNTSVDTALVNITVSDTLMGDLGASFADTLAAGASENHSFPYVVQPGDADPLVNTVTVHANPTGLPNDITDTASDTVDLVHPTIDVTKVADTEVSKVGDTVNYLITITNTSVDTALVNITVSDTLMGDLSGSFADTLASGASENHSFPYVVQPGDADPLVNTVTVHANPTGLANDITDTASDTVDLVQPSIDITKVADTEVSKVGDTVNYTITVTNTGTSDLVNITLSDTLMGDLSASFADTLAIGGSESHSFPYVVQPGDADPLVNTVTVHANPTGLPNDITDTASDTVDLVQPSIDITKVADTEVSKVGDTVNYTITITNTGTSDLVNITVSDTIMGDLSSSFADTLAIGASEQHSFPYVVQPGDADPLVNTVTVHANPTGLSNDISDTASFTVDLVQPGIDITKVADTEVSKLGDTINYTITVTNTGTSDLVNITVSDTIMGDLSGSFADTLAIGASESHSFPYVVQEGDADPLVNTVTVHANPTGLPNDITDTATETVDLVHPNFTVTKACSPDPVAPGADLTYTITITNTGDIALDYHIVDATAAIDTNDLDNAPASVVVINATRTIGMDEQSPATNTVTVTATLSGDILPNEITKTASASCEISGGPTRTPGYWFTHPAALRAAFACITGSQSGTITLCPGTCSVNANGAMAIFWKAKGGNRPTLAQHILSAMFNDCLLTPAPGTIIEDALAVLCDPNATSTEIGNAIYPLDAFNNSGDDIPFPAGMNFGSANTMLAKSMAASGTVPTCAQGKKF
jgi:uncharacterized repeat protein (TIGR01451 family)